MEEQARFRHAGLCLQPEQPWLDGFCVKEGLIRQFVAMPLGSGYSAEEQLTGEGEHGGLQIIVYPIKASYYKERAVDRLCQSMVLGESADMGLAPGGLMKQQIYSDPYGEDAWETEVSSRCFVHLANSAVYREITGNAPPTRPPSAKAYNDAGLPWFDYYAPAAEVLGGNDKLRGLDSVATKAIKLGEPPLEDNEPVPVKNPVQLGSGRVREGSF